MNANKTEKPTPVKVNLWYDVGLFIAIMLALVPVLTGVAPHEWLGIALGVAIVVHLLLHWQWLVATIGHFFGRLSIQARFNLILNFALFIDMVIVIFTGLMISRSALPLLGITLPEGFAWRRLHDLSANLVLLIMALHVAIHWRWIVGAFKKQVFGFMFRRETKPEPTTVPVAQESKQ
jgi:hypothetical protein